jgi:hypothetical protein
MTRSLLTALLGLLAIGGVAAFPSGCQSGGVGDPCTPEVEYDPQFAGFKITQEFIESRSFQCQTRICLINHFQGRVSCPLGQPGIADPGVDGRQACNPGNNNAECGEGETCFEAAALSPDCDPEREDGGAGQCAGFGNACDAEGKFCRCETSTDCPQTLQASFCDANDHHCKTYVCHKKGNCQSADADDNTGKDCCVPGTDTPVTAPVCGQCADASNRNGEDSVYCSCRCLREGDTDDGVSNYCDCPTGFSCTEIRKDVGLGDPLLTGSYCIKDGSEFIDASKCGKVEGFVGGACEGLGG